MLNSVNFRKADVVWILIFAVGILSVFGISISFSILLYDDRFHICLNPIYLPGGPGLSHAWIHEVLGLYAPLTYSLWGGVLKASSMIWGEGADCNSWGPAFHALNISLHLANTVLVYTYLKRLLPKYRVEAIALSTLIFALHPIQAEAVSWISSGRDLFSVFFGLVGMNLVLRDRWKLATVLFVLSCLSKATGVVFPLLWLTSNAWPWKLKESLRVLPSLILSLAFGVVAKSIQPDSVLKFESNLWQRPFVFLHNLGFYLGKVLLPINFAPDYTRSLNSLTAGMMVWPILIALGFICLLLIFRNSTRTKAALWIVIPLLPVSGLISFGFQEISTVADRYFYASMVGVSILCSSLLGNFKIKNILIFCSPLLGALGILSFHQVRLWGNAETLFQHNLALYPDSYLSHQILGNIYLERGDYSKAESELRKSIDKMPGNFLLRQALGISLEKLGRTNEAEEVYVTAINNNLISPEILVNLGSIYFSKGKLAEAEKMYIEATRLNPYFFEPQYNLAVLYYQQKQFEKSRERFSQAKTLSPSNKQASDGLANAEKQLGFR